MLKAKRGIFHKMNHSPSINSLRALLSQSEPKIPNGLLRLALHEKTGEHVLFVIICEKYFHSAKSNTDLMDDIISTFINDNSPLQVNISYKTRKRFRDNFEKDESLHIAYEEVYNLLLDKRLEKEQEDIKPLHSFIIELENSIINRNPDLSLKQITKMLLKNKGNLEDIDKHEMALLGLLYMVDE